MPSDDWSTSTLGACADWFSGGTPRTSVPDYWGGDIPWISASSLHDFYVSDSERRVTRLGVENGTRLMPENTVLCVIRGMSLKTEFRVGIARRPVAFGQDCKALVAKDGIDPLFLANAMRARAEEILQLVDEASHGTGRLETGALQGVEILLPPLPEQRAIARILGALDDKIELNRRMNETLEAMARAIFKSWFVDFDPVRAKADGRQPVGMDPATAALFPDAFEDSPLGKIPKGWTVRKLGDLASINESSITKGYPHEAIEYIDISSVTVGRLEGTTSYQLSDAPSRAKRLVAHGDTIWSCVRPNRKSYLFIHDPEPNLVVSTGFAVLTPKGVPPSYIYAWVTTDAFVEYLSYSADGSAYPAVRADRFGEAEILEPSPAVLTEFEQLVGPMRDRIAHNERESRTLAAIRDALLPKLLSGEIRVPDAEELVGDTE